MSSKVPSGLAHFSRLNPAVWIRQATSTSSSADPDLILLVGWMDASPRHIAKYTAAYEKLYPFSRILAITTSSIDAAFGTHAANLNRIAPVLEVLYTLPPNAKFLLHFFSNGGAFTSTLIARTYREKMGRALPVTAVVMDSSPGRATYEATVRAFAVALPKNILVRLIGVLVLRIFYGLYQMVYWLKGQDDMVEQARKQLNSKDLFDVDAPRVYIYSTADDMVDWRFVEEHGEEAKKLGYTIDREKYIETGHAGHMLVDEKRYWTTIQRLWSKVS